tara:strand:- start:4170 stop:5048 length:879 start_codon:yes stop_codon:yes gene_type:complete
MSNDINPTRSPTLTDLLQGGEDKTEQAGYDLAEFRLKSFNQMIQHACAYQVVLMTEGSITQEECTSTVQGYAHIQSQLVEADTTFCCEECGQGSPYMLSNDDGLCSWCCASLSEKATLEQLDNEDDEDEELTLEYDDKLKHFGESYQPTQEEIKAVLQEIEDLKTYCPSCGYNWAHNPHDSCPPRPVALGLCCDWHGQAEATKEQPCAAWQGGSNFAPNFETGEEFDFENQLFLAHVEHLLEGKHLLEILEGWVDIDCPACSATLEFIREGDSVRADCFHCEVGSSLNVVMS